MKTHKALLPFSESKNFLKTIIDTYKNWGAGKIAVIINPHLEKRIRGIRNKEICWVVNPHPEKGRLRSIQLGVRSLNDCSYIFIQNIDNPFVSPLLLSRIFKARKLDRPIIPMFQGQGGHPVLIGKNLFHTFFHEFDRRTTLRDILRKLSPLRIETGCPEVLVNINTPQAYHGYFNKLVIHD